MSTPKWGTDSKQFLYYCTCQKWKGREMITDIHYLHFTMTCRHVIVMQINTLHLWFTHDINIEQLIDTALTNIFQQGSVTDWRTHPSKTWENITWTQMQCMYAGLYWPQSFCCGESTSHYIWIHCKNKLHTPEWTQSLLTKTVSQSRTTSRKSPNSKCNAIIVTEWIWVQE